MHIQDMIILAAVSAGIRAELRKIFESNYNILEAINEDQLHLLWTQNRQSVAAVLIDVSMTGSDGTPTLTHLREKEAADAVPFLAIISTKAKAMHDAKIALSLGACDIISHPFNAAVVKHRVDSYISFYKSKHDLQSTVEKQAAEIHNSYETMVDSLSALIEYRNTESDQHVLRIRRFTKLLLEEVGRGWPEYALSANSIQAIASAAALHDIGKISIPDAILNKPGKLTPEEFEIMKTHTVTGSTILKSFSLPGNDDYLRYAYNICRYHHERWDGGGYPDALAGDDIPICAQIVGLVDAYDALTTDRVYKKAIPYLDASNMIINGACGVFSPKLLECFKHVRGIFEEIARSYASGYSPESDAITVPLPPPEKASTDSLQLTLTKYQALLHHFDVTAMEVDIDTGEYHLLYDPYLDFAPIRGALHFDNAMRLLAESAVHPDDRHLISEQMNLYLNEFFASGLRKSTRRYRILGNDGVYKMYSATIIRINTDSTKEKKALAIWHRLPESADTQAVSAVSAHTAPEVSLRHDNAFTIHNLHDYIVKKLGYTAEEIQTDLGNSFIQLIVPARRTRIVEQFEASLKTSSVFEIPIPLVCKDGRVNCYLFKGQRCTDENGTDYLNGTLSDFEIVQKEYETRIENLELYRTITEQSGDIIFSWDMQTDRLICSSQFKKRFGYDNLSENASVNIAKNSHIHPDDIPLFYEELNEVKLENLPISEAILRFANAEGKYLYSRVRITASRNESGEVVKLIGLISDVDREMRHSQQILDKAERDPLTKMLNKETGRKRIEFRLNQESKNKTGTLLIIDLDNFKEINDRYGHMFGDAVLVNIAEEILSMFREGDVISRIGGDEFLVFMPDMTNRELVEERCTELLETIPALYPKQFSDCKLSCSIGIAVAPTDGVTYAELFRRADSALYQAKTRGKGIYAFYTASLESPTYISNVSKRIDSDEQLGMADNSLIEYIFQRLYDTSDIEKTVDSVLEILGKQMNVSRVYIFENNADNTMCSNTFEWCNEGVPSEKDNLQNIEYATAIPNYEDNFNERGIFYCADITTLPDHLRDILEPQGIRSLLHCAIYDGNVFRGYVGIDDCTQTRMWTKEQINQLTFLSQLVSVFLLKKRAQDYTDALNNDLKNVLESQYAWIYVVEPDTYHLQFLNGKVTEIAPDAKHGAFCHKVLMGLDEPCPNCPIKMNGGNGGSCRIHNEYLNLVVNASAAPIHWSGKQQWLITCRQQEESVE